MGYIVELCNYWRGGGGGGGLLMMPKWQRLAGLAREVCTLWFQFFGAVFASKGYPLKNILNAIFIAASGKETNQVIYRYMLMLQFNSGL